MFIKIYYVSSDFHFVHFQFHKTNLIAYCDKMNKGRPHLQSISWHHICNPVTWNICHNSSQLQSAETILIIFSMYED